MTAGVSRRRWCRGAATACGAAKCGPASASALPLLPPPIPRRTVGDCAGRHHLTPTPAATPALPRQSACARAKVYQLTAADTRRPASSCAPTPDTSSHAVAARYPLPTASASTRVRPAVSDALREPAKGTRRGATAVALTQGVSLPSRPSRHARRATCRLRSRRHSTRATAWRAAASSSTPTRPSP